MILTTTQEAVLNRLIEELDCIKRSSFTWGIALIGRSFGKTTIVKELSTRLQGNGLCPLYINLANPAVCPAGHNVNWEEVIKMLDELAPGLNILQALEVQSVSGRLARVTSTIKKAGKRLLIIFDSMELCYDWREARWLLDENYADVLLVSEEDEWSKREQDRVITSVFTKKLEIRNALNYDKDSEIFASIIKQLCVSLPDDRISALFEKAKLASQQAHAWDWWEIIREADEMEEE